MMGPDWLVELAIEPMPLARESVQAALDAASRDLGLQVRSSPAHRQMVLRARSEEHLRCALLYLQAIVADGFRPGAVQVACRATPAKPTEATHLHKKQTGGSGEFAAVTLRLLPGTRGSGFRFFNQDAQGHIPPRWIPSVEKGVREAADDGDPFGLPLTDVEVLLVDGKFHDLDSSPLAFELAGAGAIRQAAEDAGVILLEPIVKVAVLAPERWLPDIVAELERRNATIEEVRPDQAGLVLGTARMADLLGFEEALRAAADGCAEAAIILHTYVEVSGNGGPDESHPMSAALRA
jgi:elongation factor G